MAEFLSSPVDLPTYFPCERLGFNRAVTSPRRMSKSQNFNAIGTIKSDDNASNTLLVKVIGVGGENDPDDIEADLEELVDQPPATGMKGSTSSNSSLPPSLESVSSPTASIGRSKISTWLSTSNLGFRGSSACVGVKFASAPHRYWGTGGAGTSAGTVGMPASETGVRPDRSGCVGNWMPLGPLGWVLTM